MSRELIVEKVRVKDKEFDYKYLKTKKAVVIIPVLPDDKIVFVTQYRTPIKETILELPAGGLELKEEPEIAALRELKEETGFEAEQLDFLTSFYSSPGITDEIIYLYLARVSSKGQQCLDDIEEIDIVEYPFEKAIKMIAEGQIKDGKTIIGLLWYQSLLNKQHIS